MLKKFQKKPVAPETITARLIPDGEQIQVTHPQTGETQTGVGGDWIEVDSDTNSDLRILTAAEIQANWDEVVA